MHRLMRAEEPTTEGLIGFLFGESQGLYESASVGVHAKNLASGAVDV